MAYTLRDLAELVEGRLCGDGRVEISGAATIRDAQAGEITLADKPSLVETLDASCAAAAIVSPEVEPQSIPYIVVDDVHGNFARIVCLFRPMRQRPSIGISPAAHGRPPRQDRCRCRHLPGSIDRTRCRDRRRLRDLSRCPHHGRLPARRARDRIFQRRAFTRIQSSATARSSTPPPSSVPTASATIRSTQRTSSRLNWATSKSATTSKSAPAPQSTAAPMAPPSSAKEPKSTTR